ncbi:uncharacterized protein LOC128198744 [Bicyclus anynana]|uniref:Uncharacterized protein LOC128198744 n=1 Tax=Bicyclus anynana TaxID=110368 RepID=A0ABM3LQZ4_BICAN|nr:uncharacterized protein LOC128198744 [Bicyclus anynana]
MHKKPQFQFRYIHTPSFDLSIEIRLFREEIHGLRKELKEFRADLCDIQEAISTCKLQMDDFNSRLINLEEKVEILSSHKGTETSKLEETILQLKSDIDERDQDLLQGDIEISNLPEVNGENPYHTVICIATKLGIDIDERDIVHAERVGKKSESEGAGRGRRVVVRLSRPKLRDDFLRNARTRRGITTEGLGLDPPTRRFYVNERLTKKNKSLFYLVRETAKQARWRFTWTKKGKIYTRQGEGKPAHQIKSESDIKRVFGDFSVGVKESH